MAELRDALALVTGANRGLGRHVARELAMAGARVLLGVRDPHRTAAVVAELHQVGAHPVEVIEMDLSSPEDTVRAAATVRERYGALHVLINNAGVFSETGDRNVAQLDPAAAVQTMTVNATAPLLLTSGLLPLLKAAPWAHVVNITSEYADVGGMDGYHPAYRMSKVALDALTVSLAAELQGTQVRVNSLDPGWMQTDMGSPQAPLDPADVARWVMALLNLPPDAPSGAVWYGPEPKLAPWWRFAKQ